MATALAVLVTFVIAGFLWFYVVRPILEDFNLIAPRAVNDYQDSAPVMSRVIEQTAQTDQTDESDRPASEADLLLDRLAVDRTRTAWIELMVYIGYSVAEIRGLLKGDTGTLGLEIEAARKRLGMSDAPRLTPIAHRPTEASYPN